MAVPDFQTLMPHMLRMAAADHKTIGAYLAKAS